MARINGILTVTGLTTLTGLLVTASANFTSNVTVNEPTAGSNPTTKSYVDTLISTGLAGKLNLTGGSLSGFLTLHANPISDFHATTKQYVDLQISAVRRHYVGGWFNEPPTDAEYLLQYTFTDQVIFASNFAGFRGKVFVNPDSPVNFVIQKDATIIGNMLVGTDGSFSVTTLGGVQVTFMPGDTMIVRSPDLIGANIISKCSFTFVGSLVG